MSDKTQKVKIAGAGAFLQPAGEDRLRPLNQGDVVELDAQQAKALLAEGSAVDPDEAVGVDAQPAPAFDVVSATDDELADYIKSEKLVIDDTVALAGNDPELAARVLAADAQANGGDPRSGVKKALTPIVG